MNRTLIKSLIRLIRTSLTRFLAVFAIVTIGVAFFTGVAGTADIMSVSVDRYSDDTNLKDITIYSNYGFDDDDVSAIRRCEDVLAAEGTKFTDVIGIRENDSWVTRIHSLDNTEKINSFILVSGRMPENEHEALAENGSELEPGFPLGSRVDVILPDGSKNEDIVSDYFIITGTVDTPLYLNEIKENSTLSNQYIRTYLYVRDDVFTADYYTEVNVLTEKGKSYNSFTDPYETYSKNVKENIRRIAASQEDRRRQKIRDEAMTEYEKGMQEYLDAEKEYNDKIRDAEKQLADGEREIRDGEAQIADGEAQLISGQAELDRQVADAQKKLADAAALLADNSKTLAEKKAEFEAQKKDLLQTVSDLEQAISRLKEAQDGLKQIDEGIARINEALDQLNDPETVILMDLLRQADPDMTLEELKALLADLEEISGQIEEIFPDLAEIKAEDLKKLIVTVREQKEADEEYLNSEETAALVEELRALDPETLLEETEGYEELTEVLARWMLFRNPETVSDLISEYEDTLTLFEGLTQLAETEAFIRVSELIENADPEQSVTRLVSLDPEQLDEMADELSEQTDQPVETVGDLISAYDSLKEQLENTKQELLDTRKSITDALSEQGVSEDGITAAVTDLDELIQTIQNGIADGERQLAEAEAQLNDGYAQLARGQRDLSVLSAQGREKLAEGQRKLIDSRNQIAQAKRKLEEGRKELADAITDGEEQLAEAKQKLIDAKAEIDALEKGSWTVLDRTSHYASATYHQTVDQMRAIGDVFPLFFILVAALVCLTTMTRMVSEQRGETGVLRALGYSKMQCASKYLIYALSATLLGCLMGSVIGIHTFPPIIYHVWRMMYILPDIVLAVPWRLIILATVSFLAAMGATTWFVIRSDMKEVPAQLLRPKAAKSGRSALIEKIGIIWKNLSFTWKVTLRNIFRYRRRFIMTILGVAGCGALMVTGFGIRDSINDMVDLQFFDILRYDGSAAISDEADEKDIEALRARLLARDDVERLTDVFAYSALASDMDQSGLDETVSVQIFSDPSDIETAYDLRTRTGHEKIELPDDGAVISEKLAENLSLKTGDVFLMEDEDGHRKTVRIAGICEMYIQHQAFMTKKYFESLTGQEPRRRALFITGTEDTVDLKDLQAQLMDEESVSSISFYDETLNNFSTMVKSLDLIVWTLIISSMALAFVVLGNLIHINVAERQREIATLKVLGFRRKEVQSYIFKENNILTILGALAGLPLGNLLHHYIMGCIEMDYVMFGRSVSAGSFVISAVLTIAFGMFVNLAMVRTLDSIKMVESLKSVE